MKFNFRLTSILKTSIVFFLLMLPLLCIKLKAQANPETDLVSEIGIVMKNRLTGTTHLKFTPDSIYYYGEVWKTHFPVYYQHGNIKQEWDSLKASFNIPLFKMIKNGNEKQLQDTTTKSSFETDMILYFKAENVVYSYTASNWVNSNFEGLGMKRLVDYLVSKFNYYWRESGN